MTQHTVRLSQIQLPASICTKHILALFRAKFSVLFQIEVKKCLKIIHFDQYVFYLTSRHMMRLILTPRSIQKLCIEEYEIKLNFKVGQISTCSGVLT